MTGLLILLAAAVVIFGVALAALAIRLGPGPTLKGRELTVHTRRPDDQSIRGVLVREYRDRIELADARYLTSSGETAIEGTVHVRTEHIAWAQE